MAEKITKIKYEPGNTVNTSSAVPRCPNGHPIAIRANRARGHGRVYCTICAWSDESTITASTPVQARTESQDNGVTVFSNRGLEGGKGVTILRK